MLAWNQLALDYASAARRGPTISSRLYALVNTALYDSWALFDEKAHGYLFQRPADFNVDHLLEASHEASQQPAATPAEPDSTNRPSPGNPHLDGNTYDAVRQLTMAVAANSVLHSVGDPLFTAASTKPLLPNLSNQATALQQQAIQLLQATGLDAASLSQLQQAALQLGQQVADAINGWAQVDGANQSGNYANTTGYKPKASVFNPSAPNPTIDSTWQPLQVGTDAQGNPIYQNPLTPQWGGVKPFASNTASLVPSEILRPYDSSGNLNQAFVAEVNEVLDLSMNLNGTQKAIAEYWEAGPGTSYPPGVWMEFTNGLIRDRQIGLDQAVQLSFSVAQSLFDAGIAAWATKYTFDSVRPITAIRQLYYGKSTTANGTPLTDWRKTAITGDQWQPYQNPGALTPNFPDVASGHSTFSTAASSVLRNLLGSNLFGKSVTLANNASRYSPNGFDGVSGGSGPSITLAWPYLSGAAEQAGISRLYGGIHFNDGNWRGQMIGAQVGAAVTTKAQSLFQGGEDSLAPASQQFGTMKADQITGLGDSHSDSPHEIYGFGGNDVITAIGDAQYSLFGGDGVDSFRIGTDQPVWIRDLQAGESIQIDAKKLGNPSGLQNLNLGPSELGSQFTDLRLGGRVLAHLDGAWSQDQLQFSAWS